jgi:hypothetical protein
MVLWTKWALVVLALASVLAVTGPIPQLRRRNIWSVAIYEGTSPWDLQPAASTVRLTRDDVTDVSARFVADPFMIQHDGQWYMFMEVLNKDTGQGDIGLAISPDGLSWKYQQIVLDEPFHLSYPFVFQWQGTHYLMPECAASGAVRIYEPTAFPTRWRLKQEILEGENLADPTLLRRDDKWWLFAGQPGSHDQLRLYFADSLSGPWQPHPRNPLIEGDANRSRPGGRIVEHEGQLYRLAQDCSPLYGNALRAYRITMLTTTEYAEVTGEGQLVLNGSGRGWNAVGMHHADLLQLADGRWRACVDGHYKEGFFGKGSADP